MRLRSLFSAKDMTQGTPWHRLIEFSIPMLLGNLAQQLYNTADSVIVGNYLGDSALAAVGSAGPVLHMLLALFTGVSTGAGIVVSQSFGAKDRQGLSVNIGNCITLSAIVSVIIMVIGTMLVRPLLVLLGTQPNLIDWCTDYLQIYFLGIAGFCFYNILSGILRGLGDSVSALGFLLVSAVLNVILDIVFVAYFNLGVPGVSLATVIAQGISAFFCYIKLLHMKEHFDLNRSTVRLVPKVALNILRIGIPSGITQAIMATAGMLNQVLANSMGETLIAANVLIQRVDGFAMQPNMSFGQAMSVYSGQNVGAGKYDRIALGVKQGTVLALSCSVVITVILQFFSKTLFGIFTDTPGLIDLAVRIIRIQAIGYVFLSLNQILGGVMRGAGDTVTPMWISIISSVVLRIPIAYLLAYLTRSPEYPAGRNEVLGISILISWTCGTIMSVIAYRIGRWKKKMYLQH